MRIDLQFSFDLPDEQTAVLSVFGQDLVLSDAGVLTAGTIERASVTVIFTDELEALGVRDREIVTVIYDDFDIEGVMPAGLEPLSLLWSVVVYYGHAERQLESGASIRLVLVDEVSTTRLNGTTAQDYVVIGGAGRIVSLFAGSDLARAQADAGGMVFHMGAGNDSAYGAAGDDLLNGGIGHDLLEGGGGNDTILGGPGNDIISSHSGDNILNGGSGNDIIRAGTGRDVLRGGAGNDVLVATGGHDRMAGGADADAFVFIFGGPEQAVSWTGVIVDFQQGLDKLWLSATGNSTYEATEAYALFLEHAVQRGNNVILRDGDWRLVIRNVTLDSFSADDFVGAGQGVGIYQWADSLA